MKKKKLSQNLHLIQLKFINVLCIGELDRLHYDFLENLLN